MRLSSVVGLFSLLFLAGGLFGSWAFPDVDYTLGARLGSLAVGLALGVVWLALRRPSS